MPENPQDKEENQKWRIEGLRGKMRGNHREKRLRTPGKSKDKGLRKSGKQRRRR